MLIGLLSVVTIATLFGFTRQIVTLEREQAFSHFQDINSKITLTDEVRIRSLIGALDKVLLVMRDDFSANRGMTQQEMLRRLNVLKVDDELTPRVSIIDANGDVRLSSASGRSLEKDKLNVADRAYFQKQKAELDDRLEIGLPIQSRISGNWVVPMSRRIYARDGSFGGVIAMTVDPYLFTAPFEKTTFGENAMRAIMGLDG